MTELNDPILDEGTLPIAPTAGGEGDEPTDPPVDPTDPTDPEEPTERPEWGGFTGHQLIGILVPSVVRGEITREEYKEKTGISFNVY